MPFDIGTHIGRYKILSLIGVGGMGEVYLAEDDELKRKVAVKRLKTAHNGDTFARFRREAQTASALNHPNIITIFEFGEHEGVHYIVTEFLNGETLRKRILDHQVDLDDAIDIGVQIGNALSVAHREHIVHRDIKPENIMISSDGYVKVLDFGLAKLTQADGTGPVGQDVPTVSLLNTQEGLIVGTIPYMAPEQLRGQAVDERVDIWSLGIILFEMITGRRPFEGESTSDVIAAILERPVPAFDDIGLEISPQVESIICKALSKDKEKRYQSVSEFICALIETRSNGASRSVRSIKQISSYPENHLVSKRSPVSEEGAPLLLSLKTSASYLRRKLGWPAFLMLSVAILGLGSWLLSTSFGEELRSEKQPTSQQLSFKGNIASAVISPDGRFIAYTQTLDGKRSLWLRLLDERAGDGTKLDQLDAGQYGGLSFTPDSQWLCFTTFNEHAVGILNKIPITGGAPQRLIDNVDSSISFSRDGRKFAFLRRATEKGIEQVITSNADGSDPKTVSEKSLPNYFSAKNRESGVAWAADDKSLITAVHDANWTAEQMGLIEINPESGTETKLASLKWPQIGKVVAANRQGEIYVTADSGKGSFQVFGVNVHNSVIRKIGDDLSDYKNISAAADGTRLVAVRSDKVANFFTASSDFKSIEQIGRSDTSSNAGPLFLADGSLIYVSVEKGNRDIWVMDSNGNSPRPLTFEKESDDSPAVDENGRYIVYVSNKDGVPHIWRMNMDGTEKKQLTNQDGETYPQISSRINSVIYSSNFEDHFALWKVPIEGGQPVVLTQMESHWASISPDGAYVACIARMKNDTVGSDNPVVKLVVLSTSNGQIVRSFDASKIEMSPEFPPVIRWKPDGRSLTYLSVSNGVSNIWSQQLSGGVPQKLTDFSADRIFSFDWSRDGKRIIYSRGSIRNDIVLFENL